MDGLEATRQIRAMERERGAPHAHAHIIALTAHATPEDRAECLANGFDAFMCAGKLFACLRVPCSCSATLLACTTEDGNWSDGSSGHPPAAGRSP